jgi:hypothetical protein
MRADRPNAPCMKCNDRWVKDGKTCHSSCEKYTEYREHLYDVYEGRKFNWEVSSYEAQRTIKINRRLHLNKRW